MNKNRKITGLITLFLIGFHFSLNAQPYLSVAGLTGWSIPGQNVGQPNESYFLLNANVPLSFGNGNLILFSPFSDLRTISGYDNAENLKLDGNGIFTSYVRYNSDSSKNFIGGLVVHNYSDGYNFSDNTYQIGGTILYSLKLNKKLTIKPGLYYNSEFFSDFFLPILGLDWRPYSNLKVFGILPRLLVVEQKISASWYTGIRFRAFITSYRLEENEKAYVKLQDRQLTMFIEKYFFNNIVISLQGGVSIDRELIARNSSSLASINYKNISPILKGGIYYRFRTD